MICVQPSSMLGGKPTQVKGEAGMSRTPSQWNLTNPPLRRIISVERVPPVTVSPRQLSRIENPRLTFVGAGGDSYAFNATMQIVTRNTNDKKSYRVISSALLSRPRSKSKGHG